MDQASIIFSATRSESTAGQRNLTIAIVNNMQDAALRATERQICDLLGAAAVGMLVRVTFYSMPGVPRAGAARDHVESYYEDWSGLQHDAPDGIIVTGAEPLAARLEDEKFWPAMTRLLDWTEDQAIPGIWSCLAAHAAVLHVDGIQRHRLVDKLSGIFPCAGISGRHQLMHELPRRLLMPHSRRHGLNRAALEAQGYTVLSASPAIGVDMFMKQAASLQLFWQGHPEYDGRTLLAEFRRDVLRAACQAGAAVPAIPAGFGDAAWRAELHGLVQLVVSRRLESMAAIDGMLLQAVPTPAWSQPAQAMVANWLAYLEARRPRQLRTDGARTLPAPQSMRIESLARRA